MKRSDNEKLWAAMLVAWPKAAADAEDGTSHKPEAAAQMAREHAEALLREWRRNTE
jgi:hypothetical protein